MTSFSSSALRAAGGLEGPILVLGGNGQIGSRLVSILRASGADVSFTVRPGRKQPDVPGNPGLPADFTDPLSLRGILEKVRPRVVINTVVAPANTLEGLDDGIEWDTNFLSVINLLTELERFPTSFFVQFGSSLEYGIGDWAHKESETGNPTTSRGASKLKATEAVKLWGQKTGRNALVVRPFRVFGGAEKPGRLLPTLVSRADDGAALPLPMELVVRDFVYVDDVVEGALLLAQAHRSGFAVFNIASGIPTSVTSFIDTFEEIWHVSLPKSSTPYTLAASVPRVLVGSPELTESHLGWVPPTSIRAGLTLVRENWASQ